MTCHYSFARRWSSPRPRWRRKAAGALTAFLILVLSIFLPEWSSALVVGAVLAAVTYALVKQGKERVEKAGSPVPEQTIETVKEDLEWAKTRATSARK